MASFRLERNQTFRDIESARKVIRLGLKKSSSLQNVTQNENVPVQPWFPPKVYAHTIEIHNRLAEHWSGDVNVVYKLNFWQRLFVLLELESSSKLAFIYSLITSLVVILNVIIFVMGPSLTMVPSTCKNPLCNNDINLCPGKMICEPQEPDALPKIDDVCIIIFTIDYLARSCLAWMVLTIDALDNRTKFWQIVGYFFKPSNVIDLVSILPFYIILIQYGTVGETSGFVRVLRIPRVLRILKAFSRFNYVQVILQILSDTCLRAGRALMFTVFFVGICTLVFSAIIYFLESGTFEVING